MHHDNGREMLDAVARPAEEPGETLIWSRQIPDEGRRSLLGHVGKLD
jgi:hypothetical protein